MRSYWKAYPLKKRSLARRESSGNKNFSNPNDIIKNPLTNMQLRSISIFSHVYIYGDPYTATANISKRCLGMLQQFPLRVTAH